MPFIGTTPTQGFVSAVTKQSFTPNGSTTAFTLTHSVSNANDLEVFVGNVRQEPTAAYSAAGTTLTMTEAVSSGLNFYVIFKNKAQVTTSDYDVSNSRFTPSKAGYYKISCALQVAHAATNAAVLSILFKNGSALTQGNASSGMSGLYPSQRASWIMPMNGSSDYAEIYVYGQNNGGAFNFAYDQPYRCEFEAIWLRDL